MEFWPGAQKQPKMQESLISRNLKLGFYCNYRSAINS